MSFIIREVTIRRSISAFPSLWKSKFHRIWNMAETSDDIEVRRKAAARTARNSFVTRLRRKPWFTRRNFLAARNQPIDIGFLPSWRNSSPFAIPTHMFCLTSHSNFRELFPGNGCKPKRNNITLRVISYWNFEKNEVNDFYLPNRGRSSELFSMYSYTSINWFFSTQHP